MLTGLVCFSSHALADAVLHNVNGYTSSNSGIIEFTALVFDDEGRVLATGDDSLLSDYADASRIDGGGRTVLPGLVDAHAHLYSQGFLKISIDVAGVATLEEVVARVGDYAADNPRRPWILGRGWNQVLWPVQEFPTAADIDEVVADRPVWLRRIDGHAAWANSKAMEIAGIDDDTPDPIGGKILRDDNAATTVTSSY